MSLMGSFEYNTSISELVAAPVVIGVSYLVLTIFRPKRNTSLPDIWKRGTLQSQIGNFLQTITKYL